ncbi:regulator of G-protein signaling 9-binding protein [Mustelus asterias]
MNSVCGSRLSLIPSQALSCLRSYLLSKLAEPGWGSEMLAECSEAQQLLNKLAASHHNLALSLGGSCDSVCLQQKLQDTRRTIHQQSSGIGSVCDSVGTQSLQSEQQAELQQICMLFASCMELFQRDLRQVRRLNLLFLLDDPNRFLTNTGMTCDLSGPSCDQNVKNGEKSDSEELSLEALVSEVGRLLRDVEMKVQPPVWSSEATTEPWTEVNSVDGGDTASTDVLTEEEAETGRNCGCRDCCIIS